MRWIELEGNKNFRDLGGYPTRAGQVTKDGVIYRTGRLEGITQADRAHIESLGIRLAIDFRMDAELSPGTVLFDCPLLRVPQENPAPSSLRAGAYDAQALYLVDLDQRGRDFAIVLRALADAENLPAVLQCSGGKDRTGMMVALLLSLLGVDDEVIADEYALSDFEQRDPVGFGAALERVTAAGMDPAILSTRPDTMRGFLAGVYERFGDAENLAKVSGASHRDVAAVRANLLA